MRRKNQVGCPCCGRSGTYCGCICNACGSVHLNGGGVITDENGSHNLFLFDQVNCISTTVESRFYTDYGYMIIVDSSGGNPVCKKFGSHDPLAFQARYRYVFGCDNGKVGLRIYSNPISVCVDDGTTCGYYLGSNGDTSNVPLAPMFYATATPTECEGSIEADFEFGNASCPDIIIPPPVRTAHLSFPIEQPFPKVCCNPCPIPLKDLTATWESGTGSGAWPAGSGVMTYYPDGLPNRSPGDAPYAGRPAWEYFPDLPSGPGERASWVRLTCFSNGYLAWIFAMRSLQGVDGKWGWVTNIAFPSYFIPPPSAVGPCIRLTDYSCSPFHLAYSPFPGEFNCSQVGLFYGNLYIDE